MKRGGCRRRKSDFCRDDSPQDEHTLEISCPRVKTRLEETDAAYPESTNTSKHARSACPRRTHRTHLQQLGRDEEVLLAVGAARVPDDAAEHLTLVLGVHPLVDLVHHPERAALQVLQGSGQGCQRRGGRGLAVQGREKGLPRVEAI